MSMSERRNMKGNYRDIDYYLRILSKYNISPEMIHKMTDQELLRYGGIGPHGVSLLREKFGFDEDILSPDDWLRYKLRKTLIPILDGYILRIPIRHRIGPQKAEFIIELILFLVKNRNI
jgi:hypothetical protein